MSTLASMSALAACGRFVTPQPSGNGNLAGSIQLQFNTAGPMDFVNVTYAIVFNVNPLTTNSGTQNMPYANVFASNFQNYSYAFVVGGPYGTASPLILQYYVSPGTTQLQVNQVLPSPSLTVFTPNSNNLNTQFQLIFNRSQFNLPPPIATSSPSASPTPTGITPTPNPSASPVCDPSQPACYYGPVWYFNYFTLGGGGNNGAFYAIDALGNGPKDTSAVEMIDITSTNQQAINVPAGYASITPTSAQITGGQMNNYYP